MRIARACWLLVCRSLWWRRASSKPEITMLIAIMGILNTNQPYKINLPSPFWSQWITLHRILHLAGTPECQHIFPTVEDILSPNVTKLYTTSSRSFLGAKVESNCGGSTCAKMMSKRRDFLLSRKCRDCIHFISLQNDWIYTLCCQHFFFQERDLLYNHRCGYIASQFRGVFCCNRCTPGPNTIQKKYPDQERNSWKQTIVFWLAEGKLKAEPLACQPWICGLAKQHLSATNNQRSLVNFRL